MMRTEDEWSQLCEQPGRNDAGWRTGGASLGSSTEEGWGRQQADQEQDDGCGLGTAPRELWVGRRVVGKGMREGGGFRIKKRHRTCHGQKQKKMGNLGALIYLTFSHVLERIWMANLQHIRKLKKKLKKLR